MSIKRGAREIVNRHGIYSFDSRCGVEGTIVEDVKHNVPAMNCLPYDEHAAGSLKFILYRSQRSGRELRESKRERTEEVLNILGKINIPYVICVYLNYLSS